MQYPPSSKINGLKKSLMTRWLSYFSPLLFILSLGMLSTAQGADTRPNIVLLVADDAGYSDFSGFGGEAQTPAMDSLGNAGVKFTNFHTMPNCTPSRSTFLTGVDNHINGVGTMQGQLNSAAAAVQRGTPGYKGFTNDQSLMVSELLKDNGYNTYMVGKWHLGEESDIDEQGFFKRGTWPIDRGFEQSFGMLNGGGDHFGACERVEGHCTTFFENSEILVPSYHFAPGQLSGDLTGVYYSSTAHTDKALEFIEADKAANTERKPFFLYFADTMPHEPNQLPAEYLDSQRMQDLIALYRVKGWDGIRADRFQKMKDLNLIPAGIDLPARHAGFPAWDDETDAGWNELMARVTEPPYNVFWTNKTGGPIASVAELKDVLAKKMAIYTGMVEFFDGQVNRLIQHLKDTGEYDNTLFVYFSDNGGDSREWDWIDKESMLHRGTNNSYENLGRPGSFFANGKQWAQAVNVPFYGAKATVAEGGLRDAFVAAFPGGDLKVGSSSHAMTTVMDVAATILDYAGVNHPVGVAQKADWENCTGTYKDKNDICPINGTSMRALMNGSVTSLHDREPIGYEIFGRSVARLGLDRPNKALFYEEDGVLWKLLRLGDGGWGAGPGGTKEPWKLFNLNIDPSESNDLRVNEPVRFAKMMDLYDEYEQNVGVIPQSALKQTDVTAGSQISYTFSFKNVSSVTDTFTPSCHSDWQCKLAAENAAPVTILAGESINVTVNIDVPTNATGLTRTTQVRMRSENEPQLSRNQILVTQVSKTAAATESKSSGGSLSMNALFLFLILLGAVSFRKRRQNQL